MKTHKISSFPEYVYTDHYSAFGKIAFSTLHRVIKVTRSRVYIEDTADAPSGWRRFGIDILFSLNRTELEKDGRAWSHSQKRYYYVMPSQETWVDEGDEDEDLPVIIKNLGLSVPFSINDVKNAYRQKVKSVHPDKGGSIEAFIALQESYEKALAFFDLESQ